MGLTKIEVCICTFRRDSVLSTLESLTHVELPHGYQFAVTVADNDRTDARRLQLEDFARRVGLEFRYVHAPYRNISVARNACLDAVGSNWLAFIDDDELATPHWLYHLVAKADQSDFVFGSVQALYEPAKTPKWMSEGDFHSNRITNAIWNGYTSNVLINGQFVERSRLRFSEALGQIGGEDTLFFFEAHSAGGRFAYQPDAIVTELVPTVRTKLSWLLLRRFRSGQIHHILLKRSGKALSGAVAAGAKAIYCLTAAGVCLPVKATAMSFLLRAALHVGVIASAIGIAPYREYGEGAASRVS